MSEQRQELAEEKDGPRFAPADYEYSTLMELLGVSVSKHLLDEHFTLIWANTLYYEFTGWSKEEYEATFHNRPDLYYREMGIRDRCHGDSLHQAVGIELGKDGAHAVVAQSTGMVGGGNRCV